MRKRISTTAIIVGAALAVIGVTLLVGTKPLSSSGPNGQLLLGDTVTKGQRFMATVGTLSGTFKALSDPFVDGTTGQKLITSLHEATSAIVAVPARVVTQLL